MTVQDLMRHTSGLIYGTRGNSLLNAAYIEAKIGSRDVTTRSSSRAGEAAAALLARRPLGVWRVHRRARPRGRGHLGQDARRIPERAHFSPLGMTDTGFLVPADKLSCGAALADPGAPPMTPRFDVAEQPRFESGGSGLPARSMTIFALRSCSPIAANSPASGCSAARRSSS